MITTAVKITRGFKIIVPSAVTIHTREFIRKLPSHILRFKRGQTIRILSEDDYFRLCKYAAIGDGDFYDISL